MWVWLFSSVCSFFFFFVFFFLGGGDLDHIAERERDSTDVSVIYAVMLHGIQDVDLDQRKIV